MQIGLVGLGKMGANMARRLLRGGHQVHVFDRSADAVAAVVAEGAVAAGDLAGLARALGTEPGPRAVWVMVPAGAPTDSTLQALGALLSAGDILIDGGNSNFQETLVRGDALWQQHGVHLVDSGTSGGIWGLTEGYALMIGGDATAVAHLRPIWETLAPAPDRGWSHVGPRGAGHYVKMVHNGIEYGLMQAYAEGFAILHHKHKLGDAPVQFDLHAIAETWRHGSVVRSWLLDLTARALATGNDLSSIAPIVSDSGEGRWTVAEAIALDVPAPVITHALIARLRSRDSEAWGDRLLAALRNQFGGHAVVAADAATGTSGALNAGVPNAGLPNDGAPHA
jgi:6-phosphogluconate dehydrogenase